MNGPVPSIQPSVTGRPVDLLGAGIDNMALLPHLVEASAVRIWVDDPDAVAAAIRIECEAAGVEIGPVSRWTSEPAQPNRLVVRSPGFPKYRPDIQAALAETPASAVTTAISLWLATFGDHYPTVIVTGTKGKSTVARMLAALVPHSELVGNIGTPIWSIPRPPSGTVMVCEVSSYQAVDLTHEADLALLTSLSEDHISWHGSVEQYHADKLGPVHRAAKAVIGADLEPVLTDHPALKVVPTPRAADRLSTMPTHMAANARLAIAAAQHLASTFGSTVVEHPEQTLLDLPAMVGRLREIPSADGHRWFDDSLASNPSGAAAAVSAFSSDPLWLILGGLDRDVSPEPLIQSLRTCSHPVAIVAVPNNGSDLVRQLLEAGITLGHQLDAPDVQSAVAIIRKAATTDSTVLFSPAAPTPPQHGNWSNRSAAFEAAVRSGSDQGS